MVLFDYPSASPDSGSRECCLLVSLGMDGVGKNSTSDSDCPLSYSEVGEDGLDWLGACVAEASLE